MESSKIPLKFLIRTRSADFMDYPKKIRKLFLKYEVEKSADFESEVQQAIKNWADLKEYILQSKAR